MKRHPTKLKKFLAAFKLCGVVEHAAAAVDMPKGTHYYWLNRSRKYRRAFDRVQRRAGYLKQDQLDRLATIGSPLFHNGVQVFQWFNAAGKPVPVGHKDAVRSEPVYEANVTALIFALKAAFPRRYRERHEHTGPKGGPIRHEVIDLAKLSDDDLAKLREIRARAASN